jgi:sugar phosphate isomerase/epimerase
MLTRRAFAKLAVAAPSAAVFQGHARIQSTFGGVQVGAQSYSFRDRPLDAAIDAMRQVGLGFVELTSRHLQPADPEAAKAWRGSPGLDEIRRVRRKFDDAGIVLVAYTYNIRDDFTDAEIEQGFKVAEALGVTTLNTSTKVSTAARIDRIAREHRMVTGLHNHASMVPNDFSTPDDFKTAMEGRSKYLRVNLDIGHLTAAGFDPVAFLEQHHAAITTIHVKDRKRNRDGKQGANVPFGQGDTPIKEVLQLLKRKRFAIPAMIEYEYAGADTVVEVRRCLDYIKEALA